MNDRIVRLIATFFYMGDMPIAPGTVASFAGLLIAVALTQSIFFYVMFFLCVLVLGLFAADQMERTLGITDPSCVVIDEVAGMMLALFLLPLTTQVLVITFFLFRAFDMFKIYPVNHLEKIKGGVGIMADDLLAGLYANLLMQIIIRINVFI